MRVRAFVVGSLVAIVTTALLVVAAFAGAPEVPLAERSARIESMYAEYAQSFPEVVGITVPQVLADRDAFVLVDVRPEAETAVSMIPGALTRAQFEARKTELKGQTVVPYCTIGYRSGLFSEELREQGFEVRNLEGSLLAWTHAGGPLVSAQGPTRRVHVYGPTWNLVAEGYEGVWGHVAATPTTGD